MQERFTSVFPAEIIEAAVGAQEVSLLVVPAPLAEEPFEMVTESDFPPWEKV